MSREPGLADLLSYRSIEALHKALDQSYRHILETAKTDWQRLFGGSDPRDACVTVRITKEDVANELAGLSRADWLRSGQSRKTSGVCRRNGVLVRLI
jgi:hypothetical protein